MDCIFCKIVENTIPAKIVFQNENIVAFEDLHPQAPYHILIIPKKHIATLNDLSDEDTLVMGEIIQTAKNIAKNKGIEESGYRLVFNCNAGAGQAVFHIHCHLLGGRNMHWPPG